MTTQIRQADQAKQDTVTASRDTDSLIAPMPKTSLLQKLMYTALGGVALGIVIGLSFVLSK
ncbi:MAG: hypothetical protein OYH77_02300 [Pseudomonadota bacterium]|nr:hypothetical protein [Pseudomonadota bacterium]